MAWQDAAISALSIIFLIFHAAYAGFTASLAFGASVGLYLLRLASWPISALYNTLLFIFAPAIYTIRFILSPFIFIFNKLPRLEPLYIYFGSAAFVGVIFGLILMLTSSSMFAILGLYDSPDEEKASRGRSRVSELPPSPYHHGSGRGDEEETSFRRQQQRPTTPLLDSSEQERLDALLANISSPDSDLGGLAVHGWRDGPNVKRKRRSAAASRIGTILEEEDDSF